MFKKRKTERNSGKCPWGVVLHYGTCETFTIIFRTKFAFNVWTGVFYSDGPKLSSNVVSATSKKNTLQIRLHWVSIETVVKERIFIDLPNILKSEKLSLKLLPTIDFQSTNSSFHHFKYHPLPPGTFRFQYFSISIVATVVLVNNRNWFLRCLWFCVPTNQLQCK